MENSGFRTSSSNRAISAIATGRDLSTARGFKEFLLTRAKGNFEGGTNAFNAILCRITNTNVAPEVIQAAHTGYCTRTGWYVFKHYAIDTAGGIYHPDSNERYKASHREWLTSAPHAAEKAIKPTDGGMTPARLYYLLNCAWGPNAIVSLSWTVAGWFVNQIKREIGFFPALSIFGPPACGKSALTVTLNACQGISGEGLPITQLNTKKALARSIARESGRFSALLEDNQRSDKGGFDYSIMLTAYNIGPIMVKASFSNDNRTDESPFLGSLLFVQNTEPFQSTAEKQRVISLQFDSDKLTETTRKFFEELQMVPEQQLARIMQTTLQQRQVYESEWSKEYRKAIDDLAPLDNRRILQNYALVLAFCRLFQHVNNIHDDLTQHVKRLAEEKCRTSQQRTYDLADHFFESVDLLDEDKLFDCVHLDPDTKLLYINLPRVENLIKNKGIQFAVNENLTKALMQHPAYLESRKQYRFPGDPEVDTQGKRKQRRVWVFDANKFE